MRKLPKTVVVLALVLLGGALLGIVEDEAITGLLDFGIGGIAIICIFSAGWVARSMTNTDPTGDTP